MELNQKLQKLRKEKGMTQEALAKRLYVSRTAISKWESGRGVPSIDSLKQIAQFFSVTLDELLSRDELLQLAEEGQWQTARNDRVLVFGLSDVSMLLLFFLPLLASKTDGVVRSASLLSLTDVAVYLRIGYFAIAVGMVITGILTLALQNIAPNRWERIRTPLSLALGVASVLLFVISLQPYAAVFSFFLLFMKAVMLIKHR